MGLLRLFLKKRNRETVNNRGSWPLFPRDTVSH
jgi:hypothetical protein